MCVDKSINFGHIDAISQLKINTLWKLSFIFIFILLIITGCVRVCSHRNACRDQRTILRNWLPPSTLGSLHPTHIARPEQQVPLHTAISLAITNSSECQNKQELLLPSYPSFYLSFDPSQQTWFSRKFRDSLHLSILSILSTSPKHFAYEHNSVTPFFLFTNQYKVQTYYANILNTLFIQWFLTTHIQ